MSVLYNLATELEDLASSLKKIDYDKDKKTIDLTRLWIYTSFDKLKQNIQNELSSISVEEEKFLDMDLYWDNGTYITRYVVSTNTTMAMLLNSLSDRYGVDKSKIKTRDHNPTDLVVMVYNDPDAVSYTHLTLPTICSV